MLGRGHLLIPGQKLRERPLTRSRVRRESGHQGKDAVGQEDAVGGGREPHVLVRLSLWPRLATLLHTEVVVVLRDRLEELCGPVPARQNQEQIGLVGQVLTLTLLPFSVEDMVGLAVYLRRGRGRQNEVLGPRVGQGQVVVAVGGKGQRASKVGQHNLVGIRVHPSCERLFPTRASCRGQRVSDVSWRDPGREEVGELRISPVLGQLLPCLWEFAVLECSHRSPRVDAHLGEVVPGEDAGDGDEEGRDDEGDQPPSYRQDPPGAGVDSLP